MKTILIIEGEGFIDANFIPLSLISEEVFLNL
ncbi:MAG: hypothetical protein ACJAT9_000538 [Polaribacter sp.]